MKNSTRTVFSAAAFLAGTAGVASAQLIGASFLPAGDAVYTGTGVLGESFVGDTLGTTINGTTNVTFPTSAAALGTSGVSLTLRESGGGSPYVTQDLTNGDTAGSDLFADALETRKSNTVTYLLSGLKAGSLYDVAFYAGQFGANHDRKPVALTIQGTAFSVGGSGNAPSFTNGGNYVEDVNVAADSSGDITIVSTNTSTGSNYVPINGIGIELVPEPSSWVSMLGGVGALAGARALRRRRA